MSPAQIACYARRATKPRGVGSRAHLDRGALLRRRHPRLALTSKNESPGGDHGAGLRPVASTNDLVIISPHLDDAVLSLGGLIGREVAVGRRVEVVSCYTAGPPLDTIAPEQRVFGDYSMRRAEDERA